MSKRSKDLFEEMQGIFGESFNPTAKPLTESMDEGAKHARGRDMRPEPSSKNAISKGMRNQSGYKSVPRKESARSKKRKAESEKKKAAIAKANTDRKAKMKSGMDKFFSDPEVRGNKGSDAKTKGSTGKLSPKGKGGGGSQDKAKGTSAANSEHHPFKNKTNLGKGPRGKYLQKTKCWNCTCPGNIYDSGCNCKASGQGNNCPEKGTLKKISYSQSYKKSYNDEYHAWRAGKDKKQRD